MAKDVQRGLGRGLSALLSEVEQETEQSGVSTLPIAYIEPNRDQPRRVFDPEALEALADSIRTHGVITPVVVRRIGTDRYQLIAGERRYRASRMAGLTELPAHIVETDEGEAYEMALVENLQREDLDPIEEAEGYRMLMTRYGLTQEQAAERVGRSRPAVANSLRLLGLPESVRKSLSEGKISAGHARAILSLPEKDRADVADYIIQKGLNVRQTESYCASYGKEKPKKETSGVDYTKDLSDRLSSALGRRVRITCAHGKGSVALYFDDLNDLDALVARITRQG